MKNADMPAVPTYDYEFVDDQLVQSCCFSGLTKREHFAAMAMQGLLSNPDKDFFRGDLAEEAAALADALLAELEK